MKTCVKCLFEYAAGKGCPECGRIRSRERQRALREADPDREREKQRAYRHSNPERFRERARVYRAANPEQRKAYESKPSRMAYQREWRRAERKANQELVRERERAKYAANAARYAAQARARRAVALAVDAERVRARDRARYDAKREADPENLRIERRAAERRQYDKNPEAYLAKARAKNQKRRARLRDACSPGVTPDQWQDICAEFQDADGNTKCAYCDTPCAVTIDHVVPLARGGRDEPDNVLPACLGCNSGKRDRLISEWRRGKKLLASALYEVLVSQTNDYLKTLSVKAA
jgi:5-methylcytosine-specific restriction endonuclease McrA